MPAISSVEKHERRAVIDGALDQGVPLRQLASQFGVSRSALGRYATKRAEAKAAAVEAAPVSATINILEMPISAVLTLITRCSWQRPSDATPHFALLSRIGKIVGSERGLIGAAGPAGITQALKAVRRAYPDFNLELEPGMDVEDLQGRLELTFRRAQERWRDLHPDAESGPSAADLRERANAKARADMLVRPDRPTEGARVVH